MNKIIDDYIVNNKLTKDELKYLDFLKEDLTNHQSNLEILKFFSQKGEFSTANKIFENSIPSIKNNPSLFYPIALIKMSLELNEEAYTYFLKYFESVNPDNEAKFNYGVLLGKLNKFDQAIEVFNGLKNEDPDNAKVFSRLGELYFKMQKFDKSEEAYKTSIQLDSKNADVYYNLGSLQERKRIFFSAIDYYSKSLQYNENHVQARWNRSLLYLREGNYIDGFKDFEVRLKRSEIIRNDLSYPDWQGEDLSGKTVLVYGEQGYGDFIQYSRFIKILKKKNVVVILEVKSEMLELAESIKGVDYFHLKDTQVKHKIDFKVALMSLPYFLDIDIYKLENDCPYIFPKEDRVSEIKQRFKNFKYKVGFVWTGNKWPPGNNIRHTKLSFFTELAEKFPEITFLSLQMSEDKQDIDDLTQSNVIDITDEIQNFNDTAAILKNLDLLITIDTSVAHLGGALGVNTWILLSQLPDWRWFPGKKYSLWYPGLKQYRQTPRGQWEELFKELKIDLAKKPYEWKGEFDFSHIELRIRNCIKENKRQEVSKLLERHPDVVTNNYKLCTRLGEFFYINNDIKNGQEYFEKSIEFKKVDFKSLYKYIVFLLREKNFNRSKELLEIAVDMFPAEAEFYYLKALQLHFMNKHQESMFYFEKGSSKTLKPFSSVEELKKTMENNLIKKTPKLTLSMIIKNEEKFLEDCLKSVVDLADEIVIVDTGSTDRSLEIAEKYSAKIFHFEWINNFAAARNYALQHSTGNWILYLDADERLTPESVSELKKVISTDKKRGIYCNVISYSKVAGNTNKMKYTRLFKNSDNIKFDGRVHEQIEKSLKQNGYTFLDSKIDIQHLGYDQNEEIYRQKAQRNLDLLLIDYNRDKKSYTAFQIGQTHIILGNSNESVKYFKEVLADPEIDSSYRLQAARFLGAYYCENNELELAVKFVEVGLKINPQHHLLNVVLAEIFLKNGNRENAEKYFLIAYETNRELLAGEINSTLDYAIESKRIILRGIQFALFTGSKKLFYEMKREGNLGLKDKKLVSIINQLECLFDIEICKKVTELDSSIGEVISSEMILNCINYNQNLSERETLLRKFDDLYKKEPNYKKYFADILFNQGKHQDAEERYSELHKEFREDPEIFLKLIAVNFNLGNREEIIKLLDTGMELYKNYPAVIEQISNIRMKI
ncbi:MAG: glycosyltransferase [Rhodothermaceae bacterium]